SRTATRSPCRAARERGAADQQLALVADLELHARQRLADAAGPRSVERVQGSDTAFGESIAFDQRHSDGLVEFGQIRAQGRRARCRDVQTSAEPFANFAEDESMRKLQRPLDTPRDFFPGPLV